LTTIELPASVEVVCKSCFSNCKSLSSVTFESNSKLQRIEEPAFERSRLRTIELPASVEVILLSLSAHAVDHQNLKILSSRTLRSFACFI
jgi:hypothetical protein